MANRYWREDRLELAEAAMQNALALGIPAGDLYDFQHTIEAELFTRQESLARRVEEHLWVEANPTLWQGYFSRLVETTLSAFQTVTEVLQVRWGKPVLVTFFGQEELIAFMHARFGYYAARLPWHKVCLPPSAAYPVSNLLRAARHEIAHAGVHQIGGEAVPRWLDEGLAVTLEGGVSDLERRRYRIARQKKPPLSLNRLSGLFESYQTELDSSLAAYVYASAGDFVRTLLQRHGALSIRSLLLNLRAGHSLERAFREAFGFPLRKAEKEWQAGRQQEEGG
jgi:hypothetical protein